MGQKDSPLKLFREAVQIVTAQIAKAARSTLIWRAFHAKAIFRQTAQRQSPAEALTLDSRRFQMEDEITEWEISELCRQEVAELREEAIAGDAEAYCLLGLAYAVGNGVIEDHVKAVRYYRTAIAKGNVNALYLLGRAYRFGEGVVTDHRESYRLMEAAAAAGSYEAEFFIEVASTTKDLRRAWRKRTGRPI